MTRLLVVASDNLTRLSLTAQLEHGGEFTTTHAATVADAVAEGRIDGSAYAALLIVGSRPPENPSGTISQLRAIWPHAPIIVLAQTADEWDIVRTLDAGASDFLVAPYRLIELKARLRAQIRAHSNSTNVVITIGPYRFEPATRMLVEVRTGATLRLTHKETEVLKYLHRAAGEPVARQTLLKDVWGYRHGADSYTVESHIYRLRRKIEADPSRPRFLVNEDGGYMLIPLPPRPWAPPPRSEQRLSLAG